MLLKCFYDSPTYAVLKSSPLFDDSDFYSHFQQQVSINLVIVSSIIHYRDHIITN